MFSEGTVPRNLYETFELFFSLSKNIFLFFLFFLLSVRRRLEIESDVIVWEKDSAMDDQCDRFNSVGGFL